LFQVKNHFRRLRRLSSNVQSKGTIEDRWDRQYRVGESMHHPGESIPTPKYLYEIFYITFLLLI